MKDYYDDCEMYERNTHKHNKRKPQVKKQLKAERNKRKEVRAAKRRDW